MSLYLGENKIADNTSSRIVGEIITSSIPLADPALHLLDGALISSAGSYAKFVNYIAGLVSNYPDLFTTEANWQSAVGTYGVCGKFVYDSTNNTVRLPKITGFTEGTTDVTALGDLIEAGLPNITGSVSNGKAESNVVSGAFSSTSGAYNASANKANDGGRIFYLDASRSSSIYGNSSTVQPQSIKVLYYIVIASSITNELNLDVADMADKDFSNITSTGTSLASGWSMPSSRYINLTLGASGSTYTAPANGWFLLNMHTTTPGSLNWAQLVNNSKNGFVSRISADISNDFSIYLPVNKGDIVLLQYANIDLANGWNKFRFYYVEGENV